MLIFGVTVVLYYVSSTWCDFHLIYVNWFCGVFPHTHMPLWFTHKKEKCSRNPEEELTFFLDHVFRNNVKFLKSLTTVTARLPDVFAQVQWDKSSGSLRELLYFTLLLLSSALTLQYYSHTSGEVQISGRTRLRREKSTPTKNVNDTGRMESTRNWGRGRRITQAESSWNDDSWLHRVPNTQNAECNAGNRRLK